MAPRKPTIDDLDDIDDEDVAAALPPDFEQEEER